MKAFVTGGAGYVGRHLVAALRARGDSVESLDLVPHPGGMVGRVEDLTRVDADVVFHVAARSQMGGSWDQFYQANVEGTRHLLRLARGARFVYTSSASVCFDGRPLVGADESWPYAARPLNHYCRTKGLAEQVVLEAGGIAIRPHLIWGKGEQKLLPTLLDLGRRGFLRRVGDGKAEISTTHVANVVHSHLLAASSSVGGVYLVTDGPPVSLWGWVDEVLATRGWGPVRGRVPLAPLWAAGWLCEKIWGALKPGVDPPLTRYLAAQLAVTHTSVDAAARRELGYAPIVSKAEGMRELMGEDART